MPPSCQSPTIPHTGLLHSGEALIAVQTSTVAFLNLPFVKEKHPWLQRREGREEKKKKNRKPTWYSSSPKSAQRYLCNTHLGILRWGWSSSKIVYVTRSLARWKRGRKREMKEHRMGYVSISRQCKYLSDTHIYCKDPPQGISPGSSFFCVCVCGCTLHMCVWGIWEPHNCRQ